MQKGTITDFNQLLSSPLLYDATTRIPLFYYISSYI